MKRKGNHIIRLIMLAASFILLLTVVIPHHHHENGLPCIHICEHTESADNHAQHHPTCDCVGHDLVFNSNILPDDGKQVIEFVLMPAFMGDSDVSLPEPLIASGFFLPDKDTHTKSLYSIWILAATGLRAPPFIS